MGYIKFSSLTQFHKTTSSYLSDVRLSLSDGLELGWVVDEDLDAELQFFLLEGEVEAGDLCSHDLFLHGYGGEERGAALLTIHM